MTFLFWLTFILILPIGISGCATPHHDGPDTSVPLFGVDHPKDPLQAKESYRKDLEWYRWKSTQGLPKPERKSMLEEILKKYENNEVDVTEARIEIETLELEGVSSSTLTALGDVHPQHRRHGLGFVLGNSAGLGLTYTHFFPTWKGIAWQVGGIYLSDYQNIGSQIQVTVHSTGRSRLFPYVGGGGTWRQNYYVPEKTLHIAAGLGMGWLRASSTRMEHVVAVGGIWNKKTFDFPSGAIVYGNREDTRTAFDFNYSLLYHF